MAQSAPYLSRCFDNSFSDSPLDSVEEQRIRNKLLAYLNQELPAWESRVRNHQVSDASVYTGAAGYALLHLRLSELRPDDAAHHLESAKLHYEQALQIGK